MYDSSKSAGLNRRRFATVVREFWLDMRYPLPRYEVQGCVCSSPRAFEAMWGEGMKPPSDWTVDDDWSVDD